jgi:putative oxidoreductase
VTPDPYQVAIAVFTVRVITGILFFFQGYDKVFNVGVDQVRQTMDATLAGRNVPSVLTGFAAYYTSYVELLGGFLLIIGFFKFFASLLLCISLIMVVTGFSIAKPMWESFHVFIRLGLLVFILLIDPEFDIISFDHLFQLSGLGRP